MAKLASELTQITLLSTHLYTIPLICVDTSAILALDEHMADFLVTLYVIADRLHALQGVYDSAELAQLSLKQWNYYLRTIETTNNVNEKFDN